MDWRSQLARRPWWAHALLAFCAYMALVYVPWDLFWKPLDRDEEVWFGVTLHGWNAKVGAIAHWIVYAAGAWGFWHLTPWIGRAFAVYVAQVSLAMFVWNLLDERGMGVVGGVVSAIPFAALAWFLWRWRPAAPAAA